MSKKERQIMTENLESLVLKKSFRDQMSQRDDRLHKYWPFVLN
jgi:hypothetical protein